jgi:hypothetical protein
MSDTTPDQWRDFARRGILPSAPSAANAIAMGKRLGALIDDDNVLGDGAFEDDADDSEDRRTRRKRYTPRDVFAQRIMNTLARDFRVGHTLACDMARSIVQAFEDRLQCGQFEAEVWAFVALWFDDAKRERKPYRWSIVGSLDEIAVAIRLADGEGRDVVGYVCLDLARMWRELQDRAADSKLSFPAFPA